MEFTCEKRDYERLETLFVAAMRGNFIDEDEIKECRICEWVPEKQGVLIIKNNGRCVVYNNILKAYEFGRSLKILEERHDPSHDDEQVFRSQFASRLYERLMLQEMTQEELAIKTGLSVGTISNYINAETKVSFFAVFKIAKVLGCTAEELIYGK